MTTTTTLYLGGRFSLNVEFERKRNMTTMAEELTVSATLFYHGVLLERCGHRQTTDGYADEEAQEVFIRGAIRSIGDRLQEVKEEHEQSVLEETPSHRPSHMILDYRGEPSITHLRGRF